MAESKPVTKRSNESSPNPSVATAELTNGTCRLEPEVPADRRQSTRASWYVLDAEQLACPTCPEALLKSIISDGDVFAVP
eukprot:4912996-Prymnesium_polylepis.1